MKIIITESQLKTLINEEDKLEESKLVKTFIKSPFGNNPVFSAFMRKVNAMSNLNNDTTLSKYIDFLKGLYKDIVSKGVNHRLVQAMMKEYKGDKVEQLQNRTIGHTNIKTFTTKSGEEKDFNDGVFGSATAKVLLDWVRNDYDEKIKKGVYKPETPMGAVFGADGYDVASSEGGVKGIKDAKNDRRTQSTHNSKSV
jgi:hypothetical protein